MSIKKNETLFAKFIIEDVKKSLSKVYESSVSKDVATSTKATNGIKNFSKDWLGLDLDVGRNTDTSKAKKILVDEAKNKISNLKISYIQDVKVKEQIDKILETLLVSLFKLGKKGKTEEKIADLRTHISRLYNSYIEHTTLISHFQDVECNLDDPYGILLYYASEYVLKRIVTDIHQGIQVQAENYIHLNLTDEKYKILEDHLGKLNQCLGQLKEPADFSTRSLLVCNQIELMLDANSKLSKDNAMGIDIATFLPSTGTHTVAKLSGIKATITPSSGEFEEYMKKALNMINQLTNNEVLETKSSENRNKLFKTPTSKTDSKDEETITSANNNN